MINSNFTKLRKIEECADYVYNQDTLQFGDYSLEMSLALLTSGTAYTDKST